MANAAPPTLDGRVGYEGSRRDKVAKANARTVGIKELPKIGRKSDTGDVLAHASEAAAELADYFIVDVDAHVSETSFWSELTDRIDSDVIRQMAKSFESRPTSPPGLLNEIPGMYYQDVFGRISHTARLGVADDGSHRLVALTRRAMDSLGSDYMVVFPTQMLVLGMHPQDEVEIALGDAFNRWLVEEILPRESRLK